MADISIKDDLSFIRDALLSVGYDSKAIVRDYDFATKNGNMSSERVDLVAFSDVDRHDLQTACIAAQRATPGLNILELLRKLSFLAAPLAIIVHSDSIELWPVKTRESPKQLQRLSYDQVPPFFLEHRHDFAPDVLTAAKTKGLQLSFMDLDPSLVEFAYKATQQILVNRFESAVREAKSHIAPTPNQKMVDVGITKVAIQLLAAAILEDKKLFAGDRSQSATQLLQKATSSYGQYFDMSITRQIDTQTIEIMHDLLRRDITFRSFTNEMLGYFYEYTFVDSIIRKELGIYYTPSSIAKQILSRLPVEDIRPPERVIFDGSCGSGSLLLAGYERLAGLLPKSWNRNDTHDYLVNHIYGMDLDPFASLVTKLQLFLIGLPSGDAWDVEVGDFTASEKKSFRPTILIGNPPFKEIRSQEGKRFQKAMLFLESYLDLLPPNGLLGIVLPETFLENSSCRDMRGRLLRECDILEMWNLPEGIFPVSQAATVVVLARKLSKFKNDFTTGLSPVRVRRVNSLKKDKKQFLDCGATTHSYVVPSTNEWFSNKDHKISSSVLDDIVWNKIRRSEPLGNFVIVKNGIIPGEKATAAEFSNSAVGPDWKPWLASTRRLEQYFITPAEVDLNEPEQDDTSREKKYIRYPGILHRPRLNLEPYFKKPSAKVLMDSGRAPGNPWRVYAAIDGYGYYPSQGFHCVIPKRDVTLKELVGFLNSPIASAWIDSKNRRRWIDEKVVKAMPFPSFSNEQRRHLSDLVNEVEIVKTRMYEETRFGDGIAETARALINQCDGIVYDELELSTEARGTLQEFFSGYRRPGVEWEGSEFILDEPKIDSEYIRHWTVTGQVIAIHPEDRKMTLWIRGFNDNQPFKATIPQLMPGWALREDAAFQASLPLESRSIEALEMNLLNDFRPIDFSFLSSDELTQLFEDTSKLNRLYKSNNDDGI